MTYDVATFVNNNQPNVNFGIDFDAALNTDQLMAFEDVFAGLVPHTNYNEDAMPVMVYENNGQPVAWYDFENLKGYVQA